MSLLDHIKHSRAAVHGMGMYEDEEPESPLKHTSTGFGHKKVSTHIKLAPLDFHGIHLSHHSSRHETPHKSSGESPHGDKTPGSSSHHSRGASMTPSALKAAAEAAQRAAAEGKFVTRESRNSPSDSPSRKSHGDFKNRSDSHDSRKDSVSSMTTDKSEHDLKMLRGAAIPGASPLANPNVHKRVADDISHVSFTTSDSDFHSKHSMGARDDSMRQSSHLGGIPNIEQIIAKASVECLAFPYTGDQVAAQEFVKIKLLGRGAIGRVYLVRHKDDLREKPNLYAIKVLDKSEMIARNKVARVRTEREILATVNHPYVVHLYASFQTSTRLYYVMEYMQGGELYKLLQKQPHSRLDESVVRLYTAQIVLALEYLHHLGFVYRDLKPENVLLRADGQLALADFDLSKQGTALAPKLHEKKQTLMEKIKHSLPTGHHHETSKFDTLVLENQEPVLLGDCNSLVGTEEYLAPEVVAGTHQTAAVDWWTLGILMYEMLTGETPFKGTTQADTFHRIVSLDVKFPSELHLSHDVKDLIKKLLHRDPAKRLGSESGASEVKAHKFFHTINFTLIRNEESPIIPPASNAIDYASFTKTLADMDKDNAGGHEGEDEDEDEDDMNEQFRGFDLVRDVNNAVY
eukprot:CAMPEP_0184695932 /NCGR_PEP_ID=MMETSP0313-20130426/3391_1 /TAXON_ID=2792 /ORGANISM="Porphyridium aerugineum, Strain SAG 1380-2" /LENGTH=630 /DNA_ID=CAMNT_0027154459 /DNA_START=247 /DNA_END=2139 /DNA_ORIENTATION=+